jgi:chloramphenicol-sensitive protein RarD
VGRHLTSSDAARHDEFGIGLLYGVAAYVMWGAFPLYFHLLDGVPPVEIVAHRIVWALIFLAVIMTVVRRWRTLRSQMSARSTLWLALAAILLATNWSVYVYAITSDQVVEASLGYFINPLVTVLMAVVVLRERLSSLQWTAVGAAVIGVAIITASSGALPWVGLALALTFGTYGLIRKRLNFGSLEGLTIETGTLFPVALVFLLITGTSTQGAVENGDTNLLVLFALLGPVTALPLLAFGSAAQRLPLATLGLLQYICPTIVFLLGVFLYQEPMSAGEWIGFAFIWVALVVLTATMIKRPDELEMELGAIEAT